MTYVSFIVTDKPTVRVTRVTDPVLEDGKGSLSLKCTSESNPPARVMWLKADDQKEPEYKELLEFSPVRKSQAGTYICRAENSVGLSEDERAEVNIQCK